ncbi:hypothetical protein BGZ88_007665 [Linnemannia elongata]|nr:hypothetical protein BGZ88_007665 [Linnemannia elongata]
MARQRSRAAPAQQTRKASTMPVRQAPPPPAPVHQAPPQQMTAPPAQPSAMAHPAPQQPGMFAQMATTAAGVAVGSAVGHTIGAGITSAPEAQQQQQQAPQYQQPMYHNAAVPASTAASCETDAKAFTKCLEANGNDMSACQWYLEQLKACQSMSAQY